MEKNTSSKINHNSSRVNNSKISPNSNTSELISTSKTNFLFDVIMPNIYQVNNIKIIQKHTQFIKQLTHSTQNANTLKIIDLKKSKIQKKIEMIVKKNTELMQQPLNMNHKPKLKKYTKQNVKKISKFSQQDKYKMSLFQEDFAIENMKLSTLLEKGGESSSQASQWRNNKSVLKNENNSSRKGSIKKGNAQNSPESTSEKIQRIVNKPLSSSKISQFQENPSQSAFIKSPSLVQFTQQSPTPFVIEFDQQIGQKRKMQQQSFEPFKQRIKRVISKTIQLGQNYNMNQLTQKVNFYLTQISNNSPSIKQKYKKIIVDVNNRDKKIKSYCQQLEKGAGKDININKENSSNLLKSHKYSNSNQNSVSKHNCINNISIAKSIGINTNQLLNQQLKQLKQYRSSSSLSKYNHYNRPQTTNLTTRSLIRSKTCKNSQINTFSNNVNYANSNHQTLSLSQTPARSLSSSRLNRYTINSSQFNLNQRSSRNKSNPTIQQFTNKLSSLLQQIQTTCQSSYVDKIIIQRKLGRMSQQWNIDNQGFRIYDTKKMNLSEQTLKLIKRKRGNAQQIQKVEEFIEEN